MAELVDLVGCFQDARGHRLRSPPHRDNLLAIHPPISPVQISTRLDSRDRHLRREEHRLILRPRHSRNLPLTRGHTHKLARTQLMPQVRVRCLVVATRLIQQPVRHQLLHHRLYPLWTSYWL